MTKMGEYKMDQPYFQMTLVASHEFSCNLNQLILEWFDFGLHHIPNEFGID